MRKDIEEYMCRCVGCSIMKVQPCKPPGLLQPVADLAQPWQQIAMDFIVELPESQGNTVIWTVINLFLKQAQFIACSGLPSARLAKMFIVHVLTP